MPIKVVPSFPENPEDFGKSKCRWLVFSKRKKNIYLGYLQRMRGINNFDLSSLFGNVRICHSRYDNSSLKICHTSPRKKSTDWTDSLTELDANAPLTSS